MKVRVYLAAGASGVRQLSQDGVVTAPAYAVSAAARTASRNVDEEELEYEASLAAEDACRVRGEHVVVMAADLSGVEVLADGMVSGVRPVSGTDIVSFHVAEHDAPEDEELLWYDATELDEVVRYLG